MSENKRLPDEIFSAGAALDLNVLRNAPAFVSWLRRLDQRFDVRSLHFDYVTMFGPHVGREDTLVFPAFHDVAGKDYGELGERFVAQLPTIESAAGVADLARFTITVDAIAIPRG